MKIQSKKSYSFSLNAINDAKKKQIIDKALGIRNLKNQVSKDICDNFLKFSNQSKFDFIKSIKNPDSSILSGQDLQHAVADVFTSYENKIDKFKEKMQFKVQKELKRTYYKRTTKTHKKGDINTSIVTFQSTKLTKVCSFLAKYYNSTIFDYIKTKLQSSELPDSQRILFRDTLFYFEKFGSRLINVCLLKRQNVIAELTEHPIEFTSLSFHSLNQISTPLIDWNSNQKSIFNTYITLGGIGKNNREILQIPTKYSLDYHGLIKDYQKGHNTSYTMVFKEKIPDRLVLAVDREDEIIVDKFNAVGVDVNIKHNLFATSIDTFIDYDRQIFDDYVQFLKKLDAKKQRIKKLNNNTPQSLSNRDQRFYDNHQLQLKDMLKRQCSELVKQLITEGKDHLIVEDLGQMGKTFCRSEEFEGFKYSRLVKMMNLSNLKNILLSICNKNGVQITFVQPHYTSQTCPICGYISRDNRKTQENFECTECGYKNNADQNSAQNILNRFQEDVLRDKLLTKTKLGTYVPRKLKKETIKQSIEEFYNYS